MAWCEANCVHFLFGLQQNSRLKAEVARELRQRHHWLMLNRLDRLMRNRLRDNHEHVLASRVAGANS